MSTATSPIDRLRQLGGELYLDGQRVRYRIPAGNSEAKGVLEELRRDREAIRQIIREQQSKPPSPAEVADMLPPGVRLISYHPKDVPFAVAPVSVVTNAGKFLRAYLADLAWRMAHPGGYAAPPLTDILTKLADAGLELELTRASQAF